MTSDLAVNNVTPTNNTLTFNSANFLQQEIAEIKARKKDLEEKLEFVSKAPNPYLPRAENKAGPALQAAAFFSGTDRNFAEKKEASSFWFSAASLALTVGMGTWAFTKYYIAGAMTGSVALGIAVAGLGLLLWYNDRALMKTFETLKLKNSEEYHRLMRALEGDTATLGEGLKLADLPKAYEGAKSGLFSLANFGATILTINRAALIGGGAALMSTAAIDDSAMGIGKQVDIDLNKGFEAGQSVVDPNDGITTQPEVISDIQKDSAEYSARIGKLEQEKLELQQQLAGYELSPDEQKRLDVLNGQIARLEAEKLTAESNVAKYSAEMTKEAKGAAGANEGEGPLWRKAKANMEYHERIAETKTTALTTAEAQKKALIEGAQDRADSLRDDQFVTSNRTRVTEIDNEIKTLNAQITDRADPEAFAKREGIWPEFNPDGFKRFDLIWQKVFESGTEVKIAAGMMVLFWSSLEAMALLTKWQQKNPHDATIKKALFEAYESHRNIREGMYRTAINGCDAEMQKLEDGDQLKRRTLLSDSRADAHSVLQNSATHSRALVEALPKILGGEETALEGFSEADKTKANQLAEKVRASAQQQADIFVARAELDLQLQKASLNAETKDVLEQLTASIALAEQAASAHVNASLSIHTNVSQAAQNAKASLDQALNTLGNGPEVADLKKALERDFELRMKELANTVEQGNLPANDDNKPATSPVVLAKDDPGAGPV